jgi:hypothetical protein
MISHKCGGARGHALGHRARACIRVFDAATCNRIDWIAGKTGTPPYGNDGLTLKEIRQKCGAARAERSFGESRTGGPRAAASSPTSGTSRRSRPTTRRRLQQGDRGAHRAQLVQVRPARRQGAGPGDREMNISAEMRFRIMARLRSDPGN